MGRRRTVALQTKNFSSPRMAVLRPKRREKEESRRFGDGRSRRTSESGSVRLEHRNTLVLNVGRKVDSRHQAVICELCGHPYRRFVEPGTTCPSPLAGSFSESESVLLSVWTLIKNVETTQGSLADVKAVSGEVVPRISFFWWVFAFLWVVVYWVSPVSPEAGPNLRQKSG